MGSKKDRNKIELPTGKTVFLFEGEEDLSALPRQQRRLRERLRAKEERKVWRSYQKGETVSQVVDADVAESTTPKTE